MKSIVKLCVIISGILFVLGIICIGIGVVMGVTPAQLVYAGQYPGSSYFRSHQLSDAIEHFPESDHFEPEETLDDLQDLSGLSGTNTSQAEEYYEFQGVSELKMNLSFCRLEIYQHEEDYISLEADQVQNYFHCRQDGETLILEDKRPASTTQNSMDHALFLTLYLPEQTYREFSAETGAGEIILDCLSADSIDIEHGVGNITIGTLKSNSLSLETGVGELEADFIQADETADIEVGTGNINLSQFDGKSLELDCGIGHASITAAGKETDYNYTLNAELGSICLDPQLRSGRGHHHDSYDDGWEHHLDIHHDAERQISINCGLGNATLNFMED